MSDKTLIEWTDATWNPITGCSVVSPGCTNCYAMRLAGGRLKHHPSRQGLTRETKAGPVWTGEVRFNAATLLQPLRWTRPRKIFVCAHGDLFAEGVLDDWIDQVFAVMAHCPQHVFQVLTKRPERMRAYLAGAFAGRVDRQMDDIAPTHWHRREWEDFATADDVLPNVWLGVSVEDQKRADERIPYLLGTEAAMRFVSVEPLLGPIDLNPYLFIVTHGDDAVLAATPNDLLAALPFHDPKATPADEIATPRLDWVIVGGESGKGARPMHPDWARSLRDQCADAGVPFFFKQWGAWAPGEWSLDLEDRVSFLPLDNSVPVKGLEDHERAQHRVHWWEDGKVPEGLGSLLVGKDAAGRNLDGVEHNAMPGLVS